MSENLQKQYLKKTLEMAERALGILEVKAAAYGTLNIPAHVQIELEDQRTLVNNLRAQVAQATQPTPKSNVSQPSGKPDLDNPSQAELDQLVELLLKCGSMQSMDKRSLVLSRLKSDIANKIPASNATHQHVVLIVNTCNDSSNGLSQLIEAVRYFDKGTKAMGAIDAYLGNS